MLGIVSHKPSLLEVAERTLPFCFYFPPASMWVPGRLRHFSQLWALSNLERYDVFLPVWKPGAPFFKRRLGKRFGLCEFFPPRGLSARLFFFFFFFPLLPRRDFTRAVLSFRPAGVFLHERLVAALVQREF